MVQKLPGICPFLKFYAYSSTAPLCPKINVDGSGEMSVTLIYLGKMMLKLILSYPKLRKKFGVIVMFGKTKHTRCFSP